MINHHPDINMLVEYASGSLPWALGISVSAHLQLCPLCRQQTQQMNVLGGSHLEDTKTEAIANGSFNRLLERIQKEEKTNNAISKPAVKNDSLSTQTLTTGQPLPKVIKKLIPPRLRWKKVSSALAMAHLTAGQNDYEVAFHKISKGGKVVEHDHKGLEVTLVLEGSFSDEQGVYQRGDFIVREPGQTHRPTATQNQDCLCFSVCAAPVKVTGFLGALVNPFLRVRRA